MEPIILTMGFLKATPILAAIAGVDLGRTNPWSMRLHAGVNAGYATAGREIY